MIVLPSTVTPHPEFPVTTYEPVTPVVGSLSWRWTSHTGESWDLTDWASPVIKLRGAQGIGLASVEHWWSDSPSLDGSPWDGMRFGRGSVYLPLMVRADSSAEFIVEQARFLRSLNPRYEGLLRVTRPNGVWREAACRYESGADLTIDIDPVKARRARYGITWALGDPLWMGEELVTDIARGGERRPLFPGPPFPINNNYASGMALVENPGDEPARPIWFVRGPFSSFRVGVGSEVVRVNLTKPITGWVEIDTNPTELTVLDERGVDVSQFADPLNFSMIPAGSQVAVIAELEGATANTAASVRFRPRYWGALT